MEKDMNPAVVAAQHAIEQVYNCIDSKKSFRLEGGAGSGKTHTLIQALNYIIRKYSNEFQKTNKQVACITFTNIASDEIKSRTDSHPIIFSSTIHSFCWTLISRFETEIIKFLPSINFWKKYLLDFDDYFNKTIIYESGYPYIDEKNISISHDDVIDLTTQFIENKKFRNIIISKFPVLFIDEYQDTKENFITSLVNNFIDNNENLLLGFFGDSWQNIYQYGFGQIIHENIDLIVQRSNFRSVQSIVNCLNKIRPDLNQQSEDPNSTGQVNVFISNKWQGNRQSASPMKGDLPDEISKKYFDVVKTELIKNRWGFSGTETKILYLTHTLLAKVQNYSTIAEIFNKQKEEYTKKENLYINYFLNTIEPIIEAFEEKKYGEMLSILSSNSVVIKNKLDKEHWIKDLIELRDIRKSGNINDVIDCIKSKNHPPLPKRILEIEEKLAQITDEELSEISWIKRIHDLKGVPYTEIIALSQFHKEFSLYSTLHGTKGAEYKNVLIVFGRGWNNYNWNRFLEMEKNMNFEDNIKFYERNRNLFYVVCSRPKENLALLFTENLSKDALHVLEQWFGPDSIHSPEIN